MDREAWLAGRRATVEATYDAEAPTYDRDDTPITPTHAHFVERILQTCPPSGTLLDAPCDTGKYFAMVQDAGRRASARGLPVVRGEIVTGDTAGYHYYPGRERVARWLADEGLEVVEDGYNSGDGYGYRHLLARATGRPHSAGRRATKTSVSSSRVASRPL